MGAAVQARGGWKIEEGSSRDAGPGSSSERREKDRALITTNDLISQHWSEERSSPDDAVETGRGSRLEQLGPEHGVRRAGSGCSRGDCVDPAAISGSSLLMSRN